MTVLLFANGEIAQVEWIRPFLPDATAIIAADGGTRHLHRLGVYPDVVIGDMDSLPGNVKSWLETADSPQLFTYPTAKNETDLELALQYACQTYHDDIYLFGAWGGRLDQSLANVLLLTHPAWRDRQIVLLEEKERVWLITADSAIHGSIGDTVSLIPLSNDVFIHHTTGLLWPLHQEPLVFGLARGISNTLTAETATISIQSGLLLCVQAVSSWLKANS